MIDGVHIAVLGRDRFRLRLESQAWKSGRLWFLPERPHLADSCLSHCNIILQCSESTQKSVNGKNRPPYRHSSLGVRTAALKDSPDERPECEAIQPIAIVGT